MGYVPCAHFAKQGSSQVWEYRCPGRAAIFVVGAGSSGQVEVRTVNGDSVFDLSADCSLVILEPAVPFRLRGLGTQCVVIMGCQDAARSHMTKAVIARMKSMGFNWKVPLGWSAPVRVKLDRAALKTGRALYIGGYSRKEGLPASKWLGPWAVEPRLTRTQAGELCSRELRQKPDWQGSLLELEGWTRRCTCPIGAQCHGDVLTRLFGRMINEHPGKERIQPVTDAAARQAAADQSRA